MKSGLKKSNKTQRKKNKSKCKSRSKLRRRMRGGEPNEINSSTSIITFSTSNGHNYKIAKNPMALINKLNEINDASFKAGIGVHGHVRYEIEIDNYKPIIDKTRDVRDVRNELFGMYFLYGQNSGTPPYPEYGLFYLLKRIQLLAVLYKIKTTNAKFSTLDVSLPINKDSILPPGYDQFPHGYFFACTKDTNDDAFAQFTKFVQQMNNLPLHLPLTQANIDELEIPSFLKMMRMQNAKIFTPLQTDMNSLDGGRRRTNRTFNKFRRVVRH
jgi:hypothetical protein